MMSYSIAYAFKHRWLKKPWKYNAVYYLAFLCLSIENTLRAGSADCLFHIQCAFIGEVNEILSKPLNRQIYFLFFLLTPSGIIENISKYL